jgi:hypothetical protein
LNLEPVDRQHPDRNSCHEPLQRIEERRGNLDRGPRVRRARARAVRGIAGRRRCGAVAAGRDRTDRHACPRLPECPGGRRSLFAPPFAWVERAAHRQPRSVREGDGTAVERCPRRAPAHQGPRRRLHDDRSV